MEKLRERRTHSFAMGWYSEVKKKALKDLTEEKRSEAMFSSVDWSLVIKSIAR